jgi:hypothetical protein
MGRNYKIDPKMSIQDQEYQLSQNVKNDLAQARQHNLTEEALEDKWLAESKETKDKITGKNFNSEQT